MGFFSDKCPKCEKSVKRGAKFCSQCGVPAPGGIDRCGKCGVQVEVTSKFCWDCGTNLSHLSEVAPVPVVANHWHLTPDALGAKIEPGDLKGVLTKGLIVEEGTRALLFQGGKLKGELPPGKHNVGGLLQRINTFDLTIPTSVILVYAQDVEMELAAGGLFTQENQTIGVKCRLVMRVEEPELFSGNLLKGRSQLKIRDLESFLSDEAKNILQSSLSSYSVKELYGNAQLKKEIEDDLQQGLQITTERNGLTIIQLRFLDFQGAAYEAIRKEKGEVFVDEEKADIVEERRLLNQRVRETLTRDKMAEFKSEEDFANFLHQTEHELGLKGIIRKQEEKDLKKIYEEGDEDKDLAHKQILERMKLEFEIEQNAKELASERGQSLESARNELLKEKEQRLQDMEIKQREELQKIEIERQQDIMDLEALKGLKGIKHEDEKVKLALEKERLQARASTTTEALLSMIDGPQAERLVKLEQLRAKEKMTPEQILALVAEASPEAAKALAEKYKGEAQISEGRLKDLQKHLAEQKDTTEKAADRIERITERAMREMGQVAGAKAGASQPQQTIVTGGGIGGQPIVIGTGTSAAQKAIKCPKCGAETDPASTFCSECGAKTG